MTARNPKPPPPVDPAEIRRLTFGLTEAQIGALCGVNRSTAHRWLAGSVRVPYATYGLLQLIQAGEIPHAAWDGWRFGLDGVLYPRGWGEGLTQADICGAWWYRKEAARAGGLSLRIDALERQAAQLRQVAHGSARLGFLTALTDVLSESET